MFCTRCGKEIDNEAKFCPFCGAPSGESREEKQKVLKESPSVRETANGNASKQRKEGLSGPAKILMCIAILCVAGAVIFAAVSLGGKKTQSADASKKTETVEKEAAETEKTAADSEGTPLLPHETREAEPGEASGAGAAEPALADKVITALTRPSFFDGVQTSYTAVKPSVPEYTAGAGLSNVSNVNDFYLNDQTRSVIEKNGFAVVETNGREFFSVYEQNRYNLLPNFVTVDSMMHVYHLYFSYLLKNTERNYLSDTMAELSVRMLEKSLEQRNELAGTEWEDAAVRNVRFFAVGAELIGAGSGLDGADMNAVQEELEQIYNGGGISRSAILDAEEDYSQYKPRGYYEGDPRLEAYFRTMMWYGRMNFAQRSEDLDRSALLITMAMDGDVLGLWETAYSVTSFFAGASDDNGYYEYRPVIDAVYGEGAAVSDLAGNEKAWEDYHTLTAALKVPLINSVPGMDEGEDADKQKQNQGFRFMGQRFTIDAAIFQNLMYSSIHKASDGSARMLPDALDIPAVFGSDEALSILEDRGNTKYPNYKEKVELLKDGLENANDSLWTASLSSRWLYTLLPLTEAKAEGWPAFMQSSAWARKDLQTFLGSYAELKHDTVLYAKQAMAEMGGDAVEQKDDRGYVEPEAEVYARLSVLTEATINGLKGYGILDPQDEENLSRLKELSDRLCIISEKELRNETLTGEEYDLIRTYGGQLEHFWKEAYRDESDNVTVFEFPAAIITDVATDPNGSVLEIGTGGVNTIYAAVLVDGQVKIASGSVFSFYQFEQPISDRLNDTQWRYKMKIFYSSDSDYGEKAAPEEWTDDFTVRQNAY